MREILRDWGYAAHLAAALVGGLAAYAVLLAAHEAMGYPGDVLTAILFFVATQAAFTIVWRRQLDRNALAMPGGTLALAIAAAAIPCGLIGLRSAYLAMGSVPEVGAPLIVPFLAEVLGFLVGFGAPMAPALWLIWRRLGQRI